VDAETRKWKEWMQKQENGKSGCRNKKRERVDTDTIKEKEWTQKQKKGKSGHRNKKRERVDTETRAAVTEWRK
jgi:hypothetical protein